MKLVTGYDRPFARQYFRRTLRNLAPAVFREDQPWPEEIEYLSERLTETAVFASDGRIGSPWCHCDPRELAKLTENTTDRLLLMRAEASANQLLLTDGLLARGLQNVRGGRRQNVDLDWRRKLASTLYLHSSRNPVRTGSERTVLRQMSLHVVPWTRVMAVLPGYDYFEMLHQAPSLTLELPS